MKIPTKSQLIEAFGAEIGDKVYQILTQPVEECADKYATVARPLAQYNLQPPMRRLLACNEAMETHGVEGIAEAYPDEIAHGISYLNVGDPYVPSLYYVSKKDAYTISTMVDTAEV